MYIRLLMYPVQMPSLMYLIFAKKQRITFFDLPDGRVGLKFFTLIVLDSAYHWAPFPSFCANQFLPRWHSLIFCPNCLAHFYIIGTRQHFPPRVSFAVRKKWKKASYYEDWGKKKIMYLYGEQLEDGEKLNQLMMMKMIKTDSIQKHLNTSSGGHARARTNWGWQTIWRQQKNHAEHEGGKVWIWNMEKRKLKR